MSDRILAIDAGTTNIRALVFDTNLRVLGRARTRAVVHCPAPGRVEQDAEQIWTATEAVVHEALAAADTEPTAIAAIGIATQRASIIIWERATGSPAHPLVSWQDMRGSERAAELAAQGYMVNALTSASKLEAVLGGVDRGRERLNAGELLWGNVDTYLAWRLSGGAVYATDQSQACVTGYYDHLVGAWNRALIEDQGIDPERFPELVDTTTTAGLSAPAVFGASRPIGALLADQQSATIAQGCLSPGLAKVTYGTSATCNANTGGDLRFAPGAYPLVLWKRGPERAFCIEGMVKTAGAMIDWAIAEMGIADSPAALTLLAASVDDTSSVYVLPALQGLGTPHSDDSRHGVLGGLTGATTRAHLARAVLEGIAFRVREVSDAIRAVPSLPASPALRVDGGASQSDTLMQIQADVLGIPIARPAILEATALGAAICAGEGAGLWDAAAVARTVPVHRVFEPRWTSDEREERFDTWRRHCGLGAP